MAKNNNKNVDSWIKNRREHDTKALENASRHFDNKDALTVNTLEAIYGQETSFGMAKNLGTRGKKGPAGYFQIDKETAKQHSKTKITKTNDPRFDIDDASDIAAKHLVYLNKIFGKESTLTEETSTIAVIDINERKLFVIASYNAGQTNISKAQMQAEADDKNPAKWEIVKEYLTQIKLTDAKVEEIIQYVESVIAYEKEFSEKSKADKKLKDKNPRKLSDNSSEDGHWITLDNGNHVLIKGKKNS